MKQASAFTGKKFNDQELGAKVVVVNLIRNAINMISCRLAAFTSERVELWQKSVAVSAIS